MKVARNIIPSLGQETRPFAWKDKIGYAFGDLSNCWLLGLVNTFITIYYVTVLGIDGVWVGSLLFGAKIFDAFVDLFVGKLADMAKLTPEGRFRPWIRKAKWFFCAIVIVMFLPFIHTLPMTWRMVFAFITYVGYDIGYSTMIVPYGSMIAAITSDPVEHTSLSTSRSVGSAISGGLTGFFIPMVVYSTVNGQQVASAMNFFFVAIVCAGLAFAGYNVTYKLTTERVQVEPKENITFAQMLSGIGKNRALLILIIADVFIVVNQILAGTANTFLFTTYFENKSALAIALLFTYGTVAVLAPFAKWLTARFGKKETSIAALFFSAALYVVMDLAHFTNPWVYLVFMFVATAGAGIFNLMVWAFIADTADYHQIVTGRREDGTIYGLNSFSRKIGQAIAGLIGGSMLTMIGYIASTTGGAKQTTQVVNRIYDLANLLPAVILASAGIILLFYPLNRKKSEEMAKEIEKINANES
ncbi:MFS transporter [Lactovum miscens]|uniref:GPH family glycoside/pentoside/hexuronide:cation symporter n=1 Tax=Lactovum miscens TaxID=190387 RepID=A0A841C5N1_9LACT|nr:glycoside-pentoside-hexuronide (GPH):cation symporter [Lactovum miscens]MBB5887654.1 GPH family glycoside/pentoside/hexuronide:cation symporter [Lactovum miscens]